MATETDPGDVFVQYRPNRRRWLVAGAAVAAVLLLLGILFAVRVTVFSPEAVIQRYFDALADRDVDAALELMAAEETAGVDRDLLTAAVLESDAYAPPEQVDVIEVTVDDRSAVAEVALTVDGRRHTTSLGLRRDEGFVDTIFHRWRITDGLRRIQFGEVTAEVTVNGELVRAYELDGPRTLPALWGGYEVGVPPDDPLWDPRTVTVLVGPERTREVDVPMVARPGVRDQVDRQVRELLDGCADRTELLPPGCPFGNARIAEADDVDWRITSYPSVGLSAAPDGFGQVTMLAVSTSEGEAVVTGTQLAFGSERPFEIVVPFPVSGVVTDRDGAVVFEPSW